MIRRLLAIVLTVTLSLAAWFAATGILYGSVQAENDKCPKNKTCSLAIHMETEKITCRHNDNKPWQWWKPDGEKIPCGESEEEEEKPTATKKILITYTPVPKVTNTPFKPKPTDAPTDKPSNPSEPDDPRPDSGHNKTAIPTAMIGVQSVQPATTVECPWCAIFTNIMFAEQTQAAAQSTMAAK